MVLSNWKIDDDRPDAAAETPTYVYVMQAGDRTKIGIAVDPMLRKRQMQNASGQDVVLRSSRQFSTRLSAAAVEKKLHSRFGRYRLHGEWFSVAADKAVEAMLAAVDPELHVKGWEPGMTFATAASPLERWRWQRAARKGEPPPAPFTEDEIRQAWA